MVKDKQPTIAIITAQYCEKLAVDAMIENKETYVRYTTVGKLNSTYFKYILYSLEGGFYTGNESFDDVLMLPFFNYGTVIQSNTFLLFIADCHVSDF